MPFKLPLFSTLNPLLDAVIGVLLNADPVNVGEDAYLKALKDKEPPETPDIKPKVEAPPQIIFPPPRTIFNTTINNVIQVNINLPQRILPDTTNSPTGGGGGSSSNTQTTYTSEVKQTLANRKFGCMLNKPYYSKPIEWCDYDDASSFYSQLTSDSINEMEKAEAKIEEGDNFVLPLQAVVFLSVNSYSNPLPIVGINQINAISKYYDVRAKPIQLLPVTGMFTNLGVKKDTCSWDDSTIEDLSLEYTVGGDDCSVPITFFSDIDGYKRDQIQIIFKSTTDKRRKRSITLPSAGDIDSINPTNLISTLPFGGTLIEIWHDLKNVQGHVQPVQKSKFYSGYTTKEEVETFVYTTYASWLQALCIDVEIKAYQIIIQDETKEQKYHKGQYEPYRAIYMGWDQEQLRWCNKKAWYLQPAPTP